MTTELRQGGPTLQLFGTPLLQHSGISLPSRPRNLIRIFEMGSIEAPFSTRMPQNEEENWVGFRPASSGIRQFARLYDARLRGNGAPYTHFLDGLLKKRIVKCVARQDWRRNLLSPVAMSVLLWGVRISALATTPRLVCSLT